MSHKVHPKIFRIRNISDWDSRWLDKKRFADNLEEDFKIREFLNRKLAKASVEKIEIERSGGRLNIIVSSARPGLIFGRGGLGIEELRKVVDTLIIIPNQKLLEVVDDKVSMINAFSMINDVVNSPVTKQGYIVLGMHS